MYDSLQSNPFCCLLCSFSTLITVVCFSPCLYVYVDGFDRVDPNESSTALKNQLVGLLQAVGYLKGEFVYC